MTGNSTMDSLTHVAIELPVVMGRGVVLQKLRAIYNRVLA